MLTAPRLTYGDVDDPTKAAVLVHGFPDTPHTWRHLGAALADGKYRAVAPCRPPRRSGRACSNTVGSSCPSTSGSSNRSGLQSRPSWYLASGRGFGLTGLLPHPGSVFELVEGVGHFLHLECPEILAAKLIRWLAE
jgi:pimeloyl-ACP methyl ester carboxylesterase